MQETPAEDNVAGAPATPPAEPDPAEPGTLEPDPAEPGTPEPSTAERAVALAQRWAVEAAGTETSRGAARLAEVLRDPNGLPFAVGFVDGVMRPESLAAAAANLGRVAPLVPALLPWYLRGAVRLGGAVAPILPAPTVPIARRVLRELVGPLVVDARPDKLGPALAKLREGGARLNVDLLGEVVLGEDAARRRLDGIHDLVGRDDVDEVTVTLPSIAPGASLWGFEESVAEVAERLLPLFLAAHESGTMITLDVTAYRDLDLTIAVFTRLLEDPRLAGFEAGVALPTAFPDVHAVLRELTAWARRRVADGGARIAVRLVKDANLALEGVDAALHGWTPAVYDAPLDAEANHVRCLDEALRPEHTAAVRVGVASRDLVHVAYAWELAGERGVRADVEIEQLSGVAQGQTAAVARETGQVVLHVPAAQPHELDAAIGHLVRRLEHDAAGRSVLGAAAELSADPELSAREGERLLAALARAGDPGLGSGRRRARAVDTGILRTPTSSSDPGLTQAVLGIAAAAAADTQPLEPAGVEQLFGGDAFVETAVFSPRESSAPALGAPGFRNVPATDPTSAETRERAREALSRAADSTAGDAVAEAARITDAEALEAAVTGTREAAAAWGATPAAERATVLLAAARALQERRGMLIEVAASEPGTVLAEADAEIDEAVDLAAYYAATAKELDRVSGAVFVPARVTLVASEQGRSIASPAAGALAALAAGSGVVLVPAPGAVRAAAVVAEALWAAGVSRALLTLAVPATEELRRALVAHPHLDRALLHGSEQTAALLRSWRPELVLQAETGGRNAVVVMPSADLDLAASSLVRSAFGNAGQKRSAASLAILVGSVARSERFVRQLVDATAALRVGAPTDPRTDVGPMAEPARGTAEWALTTLAEGESWLVAPRRVDDAGPALAGRLWTPGIRVGVQPGSRMHREEFLAPVLALMHAPSLDRALELLDEAGPAAAAGLFTQNAEDLAVWLERAPAGSLAVNRDTTGTIVQRQPFGGSGAGGKTGGPNRLVGLGSWRASSGGSQSSTLHLRGLDSRIAEVIEAAQPTLGYDGFEWLRRGALSDALAWSREYGQVRDVSQLGVERNLFRYRPVPVGIRATTDAEWHRVLRVVVAAVRAGSPFTLSSASGLASSVRRVLGEHRVPVFVETDEEWIQRLTAAPARPDPGTDDADEDGIPPRAERVRLIGPPGAVATVRWAIVDALAGGADLPVFADEVTTAGRLELLPFLREQAISITAHRHGIPDPWSEEVI
ncbi:proline dehydrogenase family protein [Microbacterium sp.]|uniref:proline dehydrogenase family protein n=1 Tax=Microbacterium sp. TaxID=51671 RepID=UPI0039E711B7